MLHLVYNSGRVQNALLEEKLLTEVYKLNLRLLRFKAVYRLL